MNSNRLSQNSIGVKTATIVGINAMVGGGIFCVPLALSQSAGPAGLLTYIFVILAAWLITITISKVAQLYPEEGSFYNYTRQWSGHKFALVIAISYILGLTLGMGLIAKLAGLYLHENILNIKSEILSLIIVFVLTLLNLFGIAISQMGQIILATCTIMAISATSIICLLHANISNLYPFVPHGYNNILASTKTVIFSFFGFESAASLFNIVKNPEKNLYRSISWSIILVGLIYLIFTGSLMLAIPHHKFYNENSTLSQILAENLPNYLWVSKLVNFSVLTAIMGTLHSLIWSSSMLLKYLIKKSNFIFFKNINPVIFIGLITAVNSVIIKDNIIFFELTTIFIVLPYITSMLTIILKQQNQNRFYLFIPVMGILTALIIFGYAVSGIIWQIKNYLLA